MHARRWIAAGIVALAAAACGTASPTFADAEGAPPPPTAPTDTAGFIPAP